MITKLKSALSHKKPPKGSQLIEMIPLLLFFLAYQQYDLLIATAVLMAASAVAMGISYFKLNYISVPLLLGTGLIMVFGALTLILADETFIKLRPTIVNLLFSATLLIGVYGFKRGLLGDVFHMAFSLTTDGWLKLSERFGFFFLFLAAMNELIWRTQETHVWVNYKIFGVMGMMMLFMMSQVKLLQRYQLEK